MAKLGSVVAIFCCSLGCHRVQLGLLDDSLEPLRSQFNAAREKPRVLALLSPT